MISREAREGSAGLDGGAVALICGGAGALGEAVCLGLASAGMTVVVADRNVESAESTAVTVRSAGGKAHGLGCDLSDRIAVDRLQTVVTELVGTPNVLVNLAGVARNAPLSKVTDEDFELVFGSHVRTTLNALRVFAPLMRGQGYGRIITTSSIAALGTRGGTSYSAAKGAIEGMTRTAALELARSGVTVNCVAPGVIDSGMYLQTPQKFQKRMSEKIPAGRPATAPEIASAYVFLASESAGYITGQTLTVCGGLTVGALD